LISTAVPNSTQAPNTASASNWLSGRGFCVPSRCRRPITSRPVQ
jgi:hypothetical protein